MCIDCDYKTITLRKYTVDTYRLYNMVSISNQLNINNNYIMLII